ncbi:MAG: hypothetical protein ACJZ13_02675 [Methylophilaceae bacterium]
MKQKTDYFNNCFYYLLIISFTFLAGCQTLNINSNKEIYTYNDFVNTYQPTSEEKKFNGKFKLFVKDKGYTGSFKFYPNDSGHEMILLSPLNQIISKVSLSEEILIEYQNKEDQNIKNFIKDLPIKEFKRILYTQYDSKPVRVDTGYYEISVGKLLKIETLSGFEPKIIKVKNKDIELTILLQ